MPPLLAEPWQVRVTEDLPLRSIDCRVVAYTALSIDGISRNIQVTYSEVKEMCETFFVCKPVCQWLDIRVSFSDGLLVGYSFLEDKICNQRLVCWQINYWKSVFWPAGDRTNGKVLQNVDSSDLLKTEIAYNTSIFAVTKSVTVARVVASDACCATAVSCCCQRETACRDTTANVF